MLSRWGFSIGGSRTTDWRNCILLVQREGYRYAFKHVILHIITMKYHSFTTNMIARIQRLADLTTLPFVLDEAHKSRTSRLEQVVSFGQKTLGKTFYTARQREEREERKDRGRGFLG